MSAMTVVLLLMLAYLALGGVAIWFAYLLAMGGHPVFAVLSGLLGAVCVLASGSVEVKNK